MKKVSELITETLDTSCQVPLNEAGMSLNRLLTKHADAGYIIVSASRHECSKDQNDSASWELSRQIKKAGYTFKRVEGGYVENSIHGHREVIERSYIVFCYDREGNRLEFDALMRFGLEMCAKFNQDSVLVSKPGEPPAYYKKDGTVAMRFSHDVTVNRAVELFFTRLGNIRFTFKESKMEDWHSVMDRHCRYLMGEIF